LPHARIALLLRRHASYSRRIWRSEDGLPQNKIQVISQTREGYLWIGTSGGLVRFDGVRFVVFDRSNTPALREDSVLSLCPARDGSLWIGTEGGGLARMKSGAFSTFGIRDGLTNGFVRTISEDRQSRLWVGTDRGFFDLSGENSSGSTIAVTRLLWRRGWPTKIAREVSGSAPAADCYYARRSNSPDRVCKRGRCQRHRRNGRRRAVGGFESWPGAPGRR